MADIELVIKIPEYRYNRCKANLDTLDMYEALADAVRKGKVLPKGHGRLKDVDAIEYWKNDRPDEIGYHFAPKYIIDGLPTIIEADKEQEHDT